MRTTYTALIAILTALVAPPSAAVLTNTVALAAGPEVAKIVGVSQIANWQTIDAHRLVLSLNPKRNYLVTLQSDCFALRHAENLGISTSNDVIYAGFDYVTADGVQCRIQRINELDAAQKVALTDA